MVNYTTGILQQIRKDKHRGIVWIVAKGGGEGLLIIYGDMFTQHNLLINLGRDHYVIIIGRGYN